MVEQLFGETPQESGKLELEGNTIEYIVENDTITLTITDETGGTGDQYYCAYWRFYFLVVLLGNVLEGGRVEFLM